MNVLKTAFSSAFALAAALLAGGSAQAAPGCDSVSQVERRIVEHADGDVDVLRAFVWRTAIVYGVNMIDVQRKLDKWRAAVECHRQVAAAAKAGAADAPTTLARR
jgi:demethoxyubiquinone hydroxylase (CLK1/Coq7/Cat5 family)